MEKIKQIENCMIKQCDFCRRKAKCDKEMEKEQNYGAKTRISK